MAASQRVFKITKLFISFPTFRLKIYDNIKLTGANDEHFSCKLELFNFLHRKLVAVVEVLIQAFELSSLSFEIYKEFFLLTVLTSLPLTVI